MMTEGVVQRTRQELLHELENSQARVVQLLESMAAAQDWQPEAAEWSFRLIAGHLAAVEETWHLRRVTAIAAGDTPQLPAYAKEPVDFGERDLHTSLNLWIATRRRLLAFVEALPETELQRTGIHATMGPVSLLELMDDILRQDQVNLRHIHQLIVAYYEEVATNAPTIAASLTPQSNEAP